VPKNKNEEHSAFSFIQPKRIWRLRLGMPEFCNSARAEFCAELSVVHRINKVAQKL